MLPAQYLILFFLVVAVGAVFLRKIVMKKWGYTKKREQKLEQESELLKRH